MPRRTSCWLGEQRPEVAADVDRAHAAVVVGGVEHAVRLVDREVVRAGAVDVVERDFLAASSGRSRRSRGCRRASSMPIEPGPSSPTNANFFPTRSRRGTTRCCAPRRQASSRCRAPPDSPATPPRPPPPMSQMSTPSFQSADEQQAVALKGVVHVRIAGHLRRTPASAPPASHRSTMTSRAGKLPPLGSIGQKRVELSVHATELGGVNAAASSGR